MPVTEQRVVPPNWKLEDAKTRFCEVVRRAHLDGSQAVTVRGRWAVMVLDAAEYERLAAPNLGVAPAPNQLHFGTVAKATSARRS
jgi:prevent-host-death family protein